MIGLKQTGRTLTIAVKLLELSAKHDNKQAAWKLANMLEEGKQIPKDAKLALEYYKQAADGDTGLPEAALRLGNIFENGEFGLQPRYDIALSYYKKSADQGNRDAMFKAACMYRGNGQYTSVDAKLACEYCKKAGDLGHEDANWKLWQCHRSDLASGWDMPGVGKDQNKKNQAIFDNYLLKALQQNKPQAMEEIGKAYYFGLHVKQDIKLAVEYFIKGATNEETSCGASTLWWLREECEPHIEGGEAAIIAMLGNAAEQHKSPLNLGYWGEWNQNGMQYKNRTLIPVNISKAVECYYEAMLGIDYEMAKVNSALQGDILENIEKILKDHASSCTKADREILKKLLTFVKNKYRGYTGSWLSLYDSANSSLKILEGLNKRPTLSQGQSLNADDGIGSDDEGRVEDDKCIVQ